MSFMKEKNNDNEMFAHNLSLMRKKSRGGLLYLINSPSKIIGSTNRELIASLAYNPFSGFFLEFFEGHFPLSTRSEFANGVLKASVNSRNMPTINSFICDSSFEHTKKARDNIRGVIDFYNIANEGGRASYLFNENLS